MNCPFFPTRREKEFAGKLKLHLVWGFPSYVSGQWGVSFRSFAVELMKIHWIVEIILLRQTRQAGPFFLANHIVG